MTEPQLPPAGWYPDPQDAQQQRWWDGTTWSGHTAPAAATVTAPTAAAPAGSALPMGAPAWTMPAGAGEPVAVKRSWYKRPLIIVPVAIVAIVVVLGIIGAIVGFNSDKSNGLENAILKDGQPQLQASVSKNLPGATLKINTVNCVETGGTQEYNCQIHLTITDPSGTESEKFLQLATGSCDSKGNCLWHTTDTPQRDNS
ncbi:MAG TPA: DUF2510 domain-containing protein [Mycobacteriales bacterium]|nr:DUF2510 domain-containing protein [Mycobacteriales bacterium]